MAAVCNFRGPARLTKNKRHQRRTLLVLIDTLTVVRLDRGPLLLQSYRHLTSRIVLSSVCIIAALEKGALILFRSDHVHPTQGLGSWQCRPR